MTTLNIHIKTPQVVKDDATTTTIFEILNSVIISLVLVPKMPMLNLLISS
jgi:hypothetical protein